MKLSELTNKIMGELNFSELERREVENGCDFDSTLEYYRGAVKDSIKESAKYFNEEEFYISDKTVKNIVDEIQKRIANDYSCEPDTINKWM